MNVLIVDTSSWISYFKGNPAPDLDLALKEGRVFLSPVVLAELLSAKLKSSERTQLESFLRDLPLCETPFEHWMHVGELRAKCALNGIAVSTPDAHVEQCCLDLEGYLLSEDQIFSKLSPLALLKRLQ